MEAFYYILVFVVVVVSILRGFRRGFARQVPALIAMLFGIVCAELLGPGLAQILYGALPDVHGKVAEPYVYSIVSRGLVYLGIYSIFRALLSFLSTAFGRKDRTILNNIGGALMSLFNYIMMLSITFNFVIAFSMGGPLLRYVRSDDGNIVEEVLLMAPALFGGPDAVDLAHLIQLEEAKKIS